MFCSRIKTPQNHWTSLHAHTELTAIFHVIWMCQLLWKTDDDYCINFYMVKCHSLCHGPGNHSMFFILSSFAYL